jgi:Fe-S cluster assembly protein SufD
MGNQLIASSFIDEINKKANLICEDKSILNSKSERWRFSPIKEYKSLTFSDKQNTKFDLETLHSYRFDNAILFVIINGKLDLNLSDSVPEGFQINNLKDIVRNSSETLNQSFSKISDFSKNYFSAENLTQFKNGLFINVDSNYLLERPIQLLNIQTEVKSFPRILVHGNENSQFTLIEQYINLTKHEVKSNSVIEISLKNGANLKHICLQNGMESDWNFYSLAINQYKNSIFSTSIISLSGNRIINDLYCNLIENGATIDISGLYLIDNNSHCDNHTIINHISPQTFSMENFKGILSGEATGVFNGLIKVFPDAQKINSSQTNRNLLLSETAQMNSNPQLEIYADDVKCSHGSTVGQIDDEALFYMQSRGISKSNATKILVKGFAGEILKKIKIESIIEFIEPNIERLLEKS